MSVIFFVPPTLGAHMPSALSLSDVTDSIPKSNWVTSDTTLQGVAGTERAVDVWQEHSVMNESVTAPSQDAEESQARMFEQPFTESDESSESMVARVADTPATTPPF